MITGHWDYRDKLPELVRICGISSGVALPVPAAAPVTATMQAAMQSQMDATRESVSQQMAVSKEQLQQRVGAAKGAVQTQMNATRESVNQQVAASKEKLQQGVGAATGAFKTNVERASASVSSLPAVKWPGVYPTNPEQQILCASALRTVASRRAFERGEENMHMSAHGQSQAWPQPSAARRCHA